MQLDPWQREQAADLLLQRPDADHLAHIGGRSERQEVARDVKSPGVHRPVVDLRLHVIGLRSCAGQVVLDGRVQGGIGLVQARGDAPVGGLDRRALDVLRYEDATRPEVLVAGRLRLAIPERLVLNIDGGELRDAFEADDDVAEVGDRGMPIVEVELLPELLRRVAVDPAQTVFDGVGRAAVARERVGRFLRRHGR